MDFIRKKLHFDCLKPVLFCMDSFKFLQNTYSQEYNFPTLKTLGYILLFRYLETSIRIHFEF
jgi:hypothetical protein